MLPSTTRSPIAVTTPPMRFAYALVLPDMRDSLSWSYSAAGFMNTINAVGYLAGALTASPLIKRFGLADPALDTLALIVRGADTARLDLAPEAAGLLAVSLGNSALAGGDDRRALTLGFPVYDALYAWARHARGETHNWPARPA